MTKEEIERRLVRCPQWTWERFMPVYSPAIKDGIIIDSCVTLDAVIVQGFGATQDGGGIHDTGGVPPGLLPNISEPATLGILLVVLRRLHGVPDLAPFFYEGRWGMSSDSGDMPSEACETEQEAYLQAFQNVPTRAHPGI